MSNRRLVERLKEWSGNCLIDGLRMKRGEPTLQELLREAATRLAVETSDQPMEFWKSEAIGANTTIRQLKEAIYWALGERDAFPEEPEPLAGKYRRRYHWRTELRKRSGLPINGQSSSVEPPGEPR